MSYNSVFILLIIITVSISGFIINFINNKDTKKVVAYATNDTSLNIFRLLIPLTLVLSTLFYILNFGMIIIPKTILYLAYFIVIFGLILRWLSVKKLGKNFNVKVSLIKGQKIENKGVYKIIRHPSYTGLLLYYFGLGIVFQNIISLFLLIIIPLFVVLYRIKIEERFLVKHFKNEYKTYMNNTSKLIPYLY